MSARGRSSQLSTALLLLEALDDPRGVEAADLVLRLELGRRQVYRWLEAAEACRIAEHVGNRWRRPVQEA